MFSSGLARRVLIACATVLVVVVLAVGCGSGGGAGPKVALLLPEAEPPRHEAETRTDFEKEVAARCEDCEVVYLNANGDAKTQQAQAESVLTEGAEVLVVDPVEPEAAAAIAEQAKADGVPLLSFNRLIEDAEVDGFVAIDNKKVGELQAEALARKLKQDGSPSGPVLMINGDPGDQEAALFSYGASYGFRSAAVQVAKEYDDPGGSAEAAQGVTQRAIAALGEGGFAGVNAANDEIAGGAIAALEGAGIDPEEKPVTGQEATVDALRRILSGQQYMTVYKDVEPVATLAAEVAIRFAEGGKVPQNRITDEFNNGATEIPSIMLPPVAVTKGNIESTVIAGGLVSPSELCTGPYAGACRAAGISG
jgi:D-xylose transport system substrate-binding protein